MGHHKESQSGHAGGGVGTYWMLLLFQWTVCRLPVTPGKFAQVNVNRHRHRHSVARAIILHFLLVLSVRMSFLSFSFSFSLSFRFALSAPTTSGESLWFPNAEKKCLECYSWDINKWTNQRKDYATNCWLTPVFRGSGAL